MAELTTTLRDLASRLDKTFRQPAHVAVSASQPADDLAMRIDRLRAMVERQAAPGADAGKLEIALSEISAKLDREARAAKKSSIGGRASRPEDQPRQQFEALGRRRSDSARAGPNRREAGRDLRRQGRPQADQLAIGALSARLDSKDKSQPDLRLVEQAADRLAERLGAGVGLERAIGELLTQLEATRQELQPSPKRSRPPARNPRPPGRTEKRRPPDFGASFPNSRRAGKAVDHLAREDDEAPAEHGSARPAAAEAHDNRLRDIPDRAPATFAARPTRPPPRGRRRLPASCSNRGRRRRSSFAAATRR